VTAAFRVLTYNVHACVGTDGRHAPERIARVIERAGADVAALQELDAEGRFGVDQPRWLAERLQMSFHFVPARPSSGGRFGNAILSRLPIEHVRHAPLPCLPGREPRAAQWVRLSVSGTEIDLVNTHLGLARSERSRQAACLMGADWIGDGSRVRPAVLCGDFNALPRSLVMRKLLRSFRDTWMIAASRKGRATFPSALPLFRLDYVLASADLLVREVRVEQTKLSRVASDHLPLIAEIALG
jgi:endonuclease/exonuclease/phosphatase family metal-dependent hydrolase